MDKANDQATSDVALRFNDIATGHVSDALERVGIKTPVLGHSVAPLTTARRFAGPAKTLRMARNRTGDASRKIIDVVEGASPGDVLVIDALGICDWAIFGDRAGFAALQAGTVGAIVHGGVRDVEGLEELNYPVFASGTAILASEGWLQAVGIDAPIILDGVLIEPRDWLVADGSGVCVIPSDLVIEVLALAEEREQIDRSSLADMRVGALSYRMAHRHFADDDEHLRDS